MRKFYILLTSILFATFSQAQIVNIPDANFKLALLNYQPVIDANNDGEIQVSEAQGVLTLNLMLSYNIYDVIGLEAFINLENLSFLGYNNLSSLDLTMFSNLKNFKANSSDLSYINITNLNSLLSIDVSSCRLSNLDVTGCNNIKTLKCSQNRLNTLNISNLTNLEYLDCSDQQNLFPNGFTNLNLSGLNNITYLNCSRNKLTSLDASNLNNLQYLDCSSQGFFSNSGLTSLNLLGSNNITYLNCSENLLTSLNVSNLTNLEHLDCSSQRDSQYSTTGISILDTSTLINLNYLNVSRNSIQSLDLNNLIHLTHLNCDGNQITNLNLNNNINLQTLMCGGNQLSNLNIANNLNLRTLECGSNQISDLDVTNNINLQSLGCSYNLLTNLDLSNSSNLIALGCGNNQISSLIVTNLNNLQNLSFNDNLITAIDLTTLHNLVQLNCNGNQLSNINLTNLENLRRIDVGSNLFTTLDFSTTGLVSNIYSLTPEYKFNYNPNLIYVNLKNGLNYYQLYFNSFPGSLPNLQFICADDFNIPIIQQNLLMSNINNVQVNSYCSFTPGGVHNKIIGTVTLDTNNNGCDTTDIHPLDLKININDGFLSGATFCNANGEYSFFNQNGNFTLTPQFQNNFFNLTPVSATLTFPLLDGSTQTQDFCITPNGVYNDVDITILPLGTARPGFDANYQLIYKNKGNQTLSGTVNLTFNDAVLDFVSANPALDTQSTNNLGWNYTNLLPFESRTINFTLNLNGPMETPAVNINDILNYVATVNPISNDETPNDNTFELNQTVVGSFDPNDKTCLEGETISPAKVGDYLHYMIRFQNSGTAPAENIVVKDMIDTSKFDINTLQLTSTSHPQKTKITGNKVEFIFEGINLPAELVNEPLSHGYVAFKIKTNDNLVIGNTVSNTADIYFDYNFPIITNTATTTITALEINQFENKSVSFYPSPTKNSVTISANDNITSIQLFDIQGRLIETKLSNTTETKLDLSKQLSGIYFVKVYTEKGIKTEKIIKE